VKFMRGRRGLAKVERTFSSEAQGDRVLLTGGQQLTMLSRKKEERKKYRWKIPGIFRWVDCFAPGGRIKSKKERILSESLMKGGRLRSARLSEKRSIFENQWSGGLGRQIEIACRSGKGGKGGAGRLCRLVTSPGARARGIQKTLRRDRPTRLGGYFRISSYPDRLDVRGTSEGGGVGLGRGITS